MSILTLVISLFAGGGVVFLLNDVEQNAGAINNLSNGGTVNNYNYGPTISGAPSQPDPIEIGEADPCRDAIDRQIRSGWGPDRPTYTVHGYAPYTTLNSDRDNPVFGDERSFYDVKDAAITAAGGWASRVTVERGHEYLLRIYVHNGGPEGPDNAFAAEDVRVSVSLPTCTGVQIPSNGFVASPTAFPSRVWGGVTFEGNEVFNLAYIAGSARIYNNHFGPTGAALSDTIMTSAGALIGYDQLDGHVPAGYQYVSYITLEVRPQFVGD